MSAPLDAYLAEELHRPLPAAVSAFAGSLADAERDLAVLYYGSTLRTGDLSGLLDFYVVTKRPHRTGLRGLVERVLWPEVSYHEYEDLKAKAATLPLDVFRRAAEGRTLDTTIWTRFVQPAAIAWSAGDDAEIVSAVAEAVKTAARYAAALGPEQGTAEAYWTALFRKTYAAEFRVESPERADTVLGSNVERFGRLLPLAWRAGGVEFAEMSGTYWPKKKRLPGWAARSAMGKPLNLARLAKAAFTFEGAARYAAYKIEKHTGVTLEVTPFRERHPILAAPGVLWTLRKARRG